MESFMTKPGHIKETYLGDGLYASFDGYQIKLRAPRINGDSEVFLEPEVVRALADYIATLYKPIDHGDSAA
jgi:hypothetical protein